MAANRETSVKAFAEEFNALVESEPKQSDHAHFGERGAKASSAEANTLYAGVGHDGL